MMGPIKHSRSWIFHFTADGECSSSQTEKRNRLYKQHVAGRYCEVISRLGTPCFYMSVLDGASGPCGSDQPARCCNVFILLMTSSCVWAQRGGGGGGGGGGGVRHDVIKADRALALINTLSLLSTHTLTLCFYIFTLTLPPPSSSCLSLPLFVLLAS